ncbi:MAG: hypothetical protein PHG06_11950 [Parabacteroides sp.]|nr:hypothetical protein [Eubacteriales bacterium]MDD4591120.1 hypothetical protein [Parabacteroides sp.]
MKLYELQKKCSPRSNCPLSKYCMKKGYSRERPACTIDLDDIEETVDERRLKWEKQSV